MLVVRVDRSPVQVVMMHYPPEFRAEAVALYRSRPGVTIKSVADETTPYPSRSRGTGQLRADRRPTPVTRCAIGSLTRTWRHSYIR